MQIFCNFFSYIIKQAIKPGRGLGLPFPLLQETSHLNSVKTLSRQATHELAFIVLSLLFFFQVSFFVHPPSLFCLLFKKQNKNKQKQNSKADILDGLSRAHPFVLQSPG